MQGRDPAELICIRSGSDVRIEAAVKESAGGVLTARLKAQT
jgi:hypothetical protein